MGNRLTNTTVAQDEARRYSSFLSSVLRILP
jgi:hypothetical protein